MDNGMRAWALDVTLPPMSRVTMCDATDAH